MGVNTYNMFLPPLSIDLILYDVVELGSSSRVKLNICETYGDFDVIEDD